MPPIYAVISFFSYRYFRSYTYYDLVETGEFLHIFIRPAHLRLCRSAAYEVTNGYSL